VNKEKEDEQKKTINHYNNISTQELFFYKLFFDKK